MNFEVGKYYRHAGCSEELHIIGAVTGSIYHMGPVILVAEEFGNGAPLFVGADETSAENWTECPPWVVDEKHSRVFQAILKVNDTCVRHGCSYCGGSGLTVGPRSQCRRGD